MAGCGIEELKSQHVYPRPVSRAEIFTTADYEIYGSSDGGELHEGNRFDKSSNDLFCVMRSLADQP